MPEPLDDLPVLRFLGYEFFKLLCRRPAIRQSAMMASNRQGQQLSGIIATLERLIEQCCAPDRVWHPPRSVSARRTPQVVLKHRVRFPDIVIQAGGVL
jgi:hypothetical protein